MQNDRFVVLTGHLSNYPLSDLVGILRHQRKSGRLLIEYAKGPATFFFQNGELVDARMNELTGLQAIVVAMAQPEAAFNFNPLIQTPRRSIQPSLQRVVSELLGCWDESALQIEAAPITPLALPPAPVVRQRSVFLVSAVLIGVGLSTVIAVTGGYKTETPPAPVAAAPIQTPEPQRAPLPEAAAKPIRVQSVPKKRTTDKTDPESIDKKDPESIKVVMQIENGRVLKASVANRRPGMENYEALALRIARQRRFAPTVNGGETVTITVRPQQ
ncbi:MAG TPA: DUF4388 domain-containing protein [Pyrinomonadaceae bacterium]|nr:DUF4388 domain-containing protein [Pyrinomonadaceae bacterium]